MSEQWQGLKEVIKDFSYLAVSHTGYVLRHNKQFLFDEAGKREKQLQFSHKQHEDGAADEAVEEPDCDRDQVSLKRQEEKSI